MAGKIGHLGSRAKGRDELVWKRWVSLPLSHTHTQCVCVAVSEELWLSYLVHSQLPNGLLEFPKFCIHNNLDTLQTCRLSRSSHCTFFARNSTPPRLSCCRLTDDDDERKMRAHCRLYSAVVSFFLPLSLWPLGTGQHCPCDRSAGPAQFITTIIMSSLLDGD